MSLQICFVSSSLRVLITLAIENPTKRSIETMVSHLKKGGIFIYPTDTVAGLGCRGDDESKVKTINKIKKRPLNKPVSFVFSNMQMILDYAILERKYCKLFEELLLQGVTFILPRKKGKVLFGYNKFKNTLGVRLIKQPVISRLISEVDCPLVTTSANISGYAPPVEYSKVSKEILANVTASLTWKGKLSTNAKSSTIVSINNNEVILLRDGIFPSNKLANILNENSIALKYKVGNNLV